MSLKIGIAGAGLVGRSLAWQLAKAGFQVTVFDKDTMKAGRAAGFTAAGMLTPYAEVETAEALIYQLGMRSLDLWPQWIESLQGDIRYNAQGSIVVAHAQDMADLNHFTSQVNSKLHPTPKQLQRLNPNELNQLEPELTQNFQHGVFLPEEAWVSADDVMQVTAANAIELGVNWLENHSVSEIYANTIVSQDQTHKFDWVIDARGTGAKPQWQEVRGVRGEVLRLHAPEVNITRLVRLMHPRYRLYLVPMMHNNEYMLGATQIESDDSSPISVRSALELLSAIYSLHPGFSEARILSTDTNCRPALIDNLPKVEISQGLMRINGLFRHGYLLTPAIIEQVMRWFKQGQVGYTQNLLETEN